MKDAATLLRLLTGAFPPKRGAHALILTSDASLMLALRCEDHALNFTFDEADLLMSPEELSKALIAMVPEGERRYRDDLARAAAVVGELPPESP